MRKSVTNWISVLTRSTETKSTIVWRGIAVCFRTLFFSKREGTHLKVGEKEGQFVTSTRGGDQSYVDLERQIGTNIHPTMTSKGMTKAAIC